ncbi:hypothetical protein [uncultured Croceitalea sp.]|uniref:hypothetical protein n=1 Tax=uncultured Croceitalea sp. TaxID=1798908 RepID=UPI0033067D75
MNFFKPTLLFLLAILLCNCASYKAKKQEALLDLPQLGTVIKTKGGVLYSAAEQVGIPNWQNVKVDVQELPFNLESYVTYAKHMRRAGKINTIPYNDSLRYKPKYIRLQLQSKIELTQLLNSEENRETRAYISLDKDHKLVSAIDIALTENEIAMYNAAKGTHLAKDKLGNLIVVLNSDNQKQQILLKDLPSFNYQISSFCWGEDKYHNPRIENIITNGDGCPKTTYLKASKLKSKSTLKF